MSIVETAMCACIASTCHAQDQDGEYTPPTNLEVVRTLAERVGMRIGTLLAGDDSTTVKLTVQPGQIAWYLEDGLARGLSRQGCAVVASGAATHTAEFGLLNVTVGYSNIRRRGFFGANIVDRTITETLSARIIDQRSGAFVAASDMHEEARDSIEVSDVDRVESPYIPLLRGTLPPEGFFSNVVEPAVLLGAVAVAIFLLFKVRS